MHADSVRPAPLWRRFAALVYDGLLLLGLCFAFTGFAVLLNGGEKVSGLLFQLGLYCICLAYHLIFWQITGQTPGMFLLGLCACRPGGSRISAWQGLVRFLISTPALLCCGLGFFWTLWEKEGRSWQDLASGTQTLLRRRQTPDPGVR